MAYNVQPVNSFGKGLNLRDNAHQVTSDEAIDLLNVVFSERGSVGQRYGYAQFTDAALTNQVDSLTPYYTSSGTKQLIAGCGTRLEALDTGGDIVSSATGLTGGPWSFTRFASPGSELIYAGNGSDTLRKWDGSSWSAPTATVDGTAARAMPEAGVLAIQTPDNRLVATGFGTNTSGGPHAVTTNPSRVFFSNPGLPETWETDGTAPRGANYVDLTPGDGEQVMGAASFRNQLFIFKESKFFVFYGNNTASTGTPVFNYRLIDAGVGLASRRAVAVGLDGVYFLDRSGVYRTNGTEPTLVSSVLDPFFVGGTSIYFRRSPLNHAQISKAAMTFYENRLHLAVPSAASTNDTMLVYDPRFKWWSLWDIAASALTSFRISNQAELCFGYPAGAKEIGRYSSSYTSDDGTAITSRWRMGWPDFSEPTIKTVREVKLWGNGECSVGLTSDFTTSTGITQAVQFSTISDTWGDGLGTDTWGAGSPTDLWGPYSQMTVRLARQAIRGTNFSVEISNSTLNKTWSVARLAFHVREKRMPSIVTTDR